MSQKLESVVQDVLKQNHVGVFGHYLLSTGDIVRLVAIVLKVLGTLATDACQKCISDIVNDVQSS